ncbi:hypothetical protein CTEN210_00487 [Chaetoceros tenuissimus]|uniref:RING-type domain-containing protein n=1 Tax=Chaetoceros tenuissimus TaxID=426638 RepID=A0AAD3GZ05_9STRA|nr:hypothetical protein CTEN210_00487 [Chaetoceros tenuissimus]
MNSILSICTYPNIILHEAQSLMCNLSPEQAFAILFVSSIVSSFVSLFFLMACTEFFTRKVPDENICYEKFLVTRINRKDVHSEANCAICLGSFEKNERISKSKWCSHEFHTCCYKQWLNSHPSCPYCRRNVLCGNAHRRASEKFQ